MPLSSFGLLSRKYFFGLKSPLIKSFIIQYNKHIITNADNKSNITFPFTWLIFHCYAANIVNVIDIVLFYFLCFEKQQILQILESLYGVRLDKESR